MFLSGGLQFSQTHDRCSCRERQGETALHFPPAWSQHLCANLENDGHFPQPAVPTREGKGRNCLVPVSEWQQAVLPFRRALGFSCLQTRARHHSQCLRMWQQLVTEGTG